MDTIEQDLLHRIITDPPFAKYITQRIDIGDFDDEIANTIYDGIVDLLYQEQRISIEILGEYFEGKEFITKVLNDLAKGAAYPSHST
jgi:replicative DNA helicase